MAGSPMSGRSGAASPAGADARPVEAHSSPAGVRCGSPTSLTTPPGNARAAWETTLHLLAKEVLLGARRVLLPEAGAEFGGATERVAGATWFAYGAVSEEVGLGSIRPDIVLAAGGRELLVEAAVTHFCDAEKSRSCGTATCPPSKSACHPGSNLLERDGIFYDQTTGLQGTQNGPASYGTVSSFTP